MANEKPISAEAERMHIVANAQYVKDISFESPKVPAIFLKADIKPKIDLAVDIRAQKVAKDKEIYEVSLHLNAKANMDGEALFLVELTYSGLFTIAHLAQEHLEPALFIYCPSLLFPFARRIVADITRDGGFPPLLIEPVDFAGLYQKRKIESVEKKKAAN